MNSPKTDGPKYDFADPHGPHFSDLPQSDQPAWEEVDAGRFMPRRVRGSFQGRALG